MEYLKKHENKKYNSIDEIKAIIWTKCYIIEDLIWNWWIKKNSSSRRRKVIFNKIIYRLKNKYYNVRKDLESK